MNALAIETIDVPSKGGAGPPSLQTILFGIVQRPSVGPSERLLFHCVTPACDLGDGGTLTSFVEQPTQRRSGLAVADAGVFFAEADQETYGRISFCAPSGCPATRTVWVDFLDVPTGVLSVGKKRFFFAEDGPGDAGTRGCNRPQCQIDAGPAVAPFNLGGSVKADALGAVDDDLYYAAGPGKLFYCANASASTTCAPQPTLDEPAIGPIHTIAFTPGTVVVASATAVRACPRPSAAPCTAATLDNVTLGLTRPFVGVAAAAAAIAVAREDGVYVCDVASAAACSAPLMVAKLPSGTRASAVAMDATHVYLGTDKGLFAVVR